MIKWLAIGDSITHERAEVGDVYAELLTPRLSVSLPTFFNGTYSDRYIPSGTPIINHGRGGWATQYYGLTNVTGFYEDAATWKKEALDENPDLCTIMLGTNDAISDSPYVEVRVSLADYEANLRGMVADLLTQNPECMVILMTPPPVPTTTNTPIPALSNARVNTYAQVVRDLSVELNLQLIDIYTGLWDAAGNNEVTLASDWMFDYVHPNQQSHYLFADLIEAAFIASLTSAGTITIDDGTTRSEIPFYDDYILGNTGGIVLSDGSGHFRVGLVDSGGVAVADNGTTRKQFEIL